MTDTEFVKQAVAENAARIIRAHAEIFACAELAYEEFRSMEPLTGILDEVPEEKQEAFLEVLQDMSETFTETQRIARESIKR